MSFSSTTDKQTTKFQSVMANLFYLICVGGFMLAFFYQQDASEDRYEQLQQRMDERLEEQNKRINELERDKLFREGYERGKAESAQSADKPTGKD